MNEVDLKKKAEELELRLSLQLNQLKRDSQVWLVGGGVALAIGLLTYGIVQKKRKKRNKRRSRLTPEQQVDTGYRSHKRRTSRRPSPSRKSSLVSSLKRRLLFALLSYGRTKLVNELTRRKKNWA